MNAQEIISMVGLIGLGGLLKTVLDFFISDKKNRTEAKQKYKEERYKAIVILLYSHLHYKREKNNLAIHRPLITNRDELFYELHAEWMNMSLYASDLVMKSMKNYLTKTDEDAFKKILLAMRKDLYGIKTKLDSNDNPLDINNN